jgi:DNA-directed RNA polymerase subunit RPC12/RpoP
MGLKSINVFFHCHEHGNDVETFEVGGSRFCAKCVAKTLSRCGTNFATVVTIAKEEDVDVEYTCPDCGMK